MMIARERTDFSWYVPTRDQRKAALRPDLLGVLLPVQPHVSAKGNPGDFPNCTGAVAPSRQRLAEADGKGLNKNAAPACCHVVAQFVDEYQDAQHHDEGDDRAEQVGNSMSQRLLSPI